MYLEWLIRYRATARDDISRLRLELPSANVVRFVALLWHDSVKESDGLECGSDDVGSGYLSAECLAAMDGLVRQATDAGLWVIIAARAKYAAGWDWPAHPDVFHDAALSRRYHAMLGFVAARYRTWSRIAGFEVMSEPRTKVVAQAEVMGFMQAGCDAIHAEDARALCVVGPAPYYKAWNFDASVLLPRRNVLYTFDFFVPWHFASGDSRKDAAAWPGSYPCNGVYETWWSSAPTAHCATADTPVRVDEAWLRSTLRDVPHKLRQAHGVPVYCNQWGVKGEVLASRGRLAYAAALLKAFVELNISSTYWLWRSMEKGGRDVAAPVWGFELVHNSGTEEAIDAEMIGVLRRGFPPTAAAPDTAGRPADGVLGWPTPPPPVRHSPPPPPPPLPPSLPREPPSQSQSQRFEPARPERPPLQDSLSLAQPLPQAQQMESEPEPGLSGWELVGLALRGVLIAASDSDAAGDGSSSSADDDALVAAAAVIGGSLAGCAACVLGCRRRRATSCRVPRATTVPHAASPAVARRAGGRHRTDRTKPSPLAPRRLREPGAGGQQRSHPVKVARYQPVAVGVEE